MLQLIWSGQAQMVVWGDDTSTSDDIDGLLAGQEINFQLVDGDELYDLDILTLVMVHLHMLQMVLMLTVVQILLSLFVH